MKAKKGIEQLSDRSVIINPSTHKYSFIFMHGLGDTANGGFFEVFSQTPITKENTKILLLQAPQRKVTINFEMVLPSWFDIKQFVIDDEKFNECVSIEEINDSATIIKKIVDQESKLVGSNNVFIGGFSQGAAMALIVGLTYPEPLGGIIVLSGFLSPFVKQNELQYQTPLFISHGTQDNLLDFKRCMQSYEKLDNSKRKVCRIHKMPYQGHEVNEQTIKNLQQFFQEI